MDQTGIIMSQNMRNQPGEGQGNTEHGNENQERKYEGFEGMNYEQRRQPYQPQNMSNSRNMIENSSGRESGNES